MEGRRIQGPGNPTVHDRFVLGLVRQLLGRQHDVHTSLLHDPELKRFVLVIRAPRPVDLPLDPVPGIACIRGVPVRMRPRQKRARGPIALPPVPVSGQMSIAVELLQQEHADAVRRAWPALEGGRPVIAVTPKGGGAGLPSLYRGYPVVVREVSRRRRRRRR